MKFNIYNKMAIILLAIVLILEGISIILNANDIWEALQLVFLVVIAFDVGVIVGHKVIE